MIIFLHYFILAGFDYGVNELIFRRFKGLIRCLRILFAYLLPEHEMSRR